MSNSTNPVLLWISNVLNNTTLIIAIISLATTVYFNYFVRKQLILAQYRIEYVKEIYPQLLTDIKICLTKYDEFKETGNVLIRKISMLESINIDGRIEFIKSTNTALHNDLETLYGEFKDKSNKLQDLRTFNYRNIKQRWGNYLEGVEPHTQFGHRAFGDELYENTFKIYLKKDYEGIRKKYEENLEIVVNKAKQNIPFPDGTIDRLIEIVKEETKEMLKLISEIDKIIKETIIDKIIPNMQKTIGNPS